MCITHLLCHSVIRFAMEGTLLCLCRLYLYYQMVNCCVASIFSTFTG
uniref:Uncharacterized protein n=1 Tax=Anguilla anguilla TaxID=7936 RepID=A0A0E9R9T8_ANGAN